MPMRVRPRGHWIASGLDHEGRVLYSKAGPRRNKGLQQELEPKADLTLTKAEKRAQKRLDRRVRDTFGVGLS